MSLVDMRRKMPLMLPLVWAFVAIFIGGVAFTTLNTGGGGSYGRLPAEETLAKVGPHEVPNAQLTGVLRQYDQFARNMPAAQQAEMPQYAWEQIIREYATADAARAVGVSASEADAEAEIARQIEQVLEQIGKGSTKAELADMRAQMRANADIGAEQRRLLSQRLQEKLNKDARPVEVRVAAILVKLDKRSDVEALRRAQEVARQARAGADFSRLAKQFSDDPATKDQGGVRGWVSAQPPTPPVGKDVKPDLNAAQTFDPAFTGAALALRPNGISDPVRTPEGYYVIKALEERSFTPKPPAPDPKDPKKTPDPQAQQQQIDQYRSAVANAVAQGLIGQYQAKLEAQIEPQSDWLKGYYAEKQLGPAPPPAGDKPASAAQKEQARKDAQAVAPVAELYAKALKDNEPAAGPGLAYKLSQLYLRAADGYDRAGDAAQAKAQRELALGVLEKWARRSGDVSMWVQQGQVLEKLARKTDAVKVYEDAIDRSGENINALGQIAERLKALGRADLAEKARAKESQVLAKRAEEAAQQKKREDEAKKAAAAGKTGSGTTAPAPVNAR
jgi:parvulin-like peptidyl-prolyl isomerase